MIRLIVTPATLGKFTASLDGQPIVTGSRQPLADAARELVARGYDPVTALTMRHEGSAFDSFDPLPIGEWAKWTFEDGERGLRKRLWMPFPGGAGGQKLGSEPSSAPEGPNDADRG